ncbi:ABC transporter ATP-binding protein [Paenibacillus agricola]|uniref:ABC transporter ATP-binding protein n=1 Tax=Paenibacillus agricola TaxID=2716264 RepID=UPI002892CD3B|nr:ATP-binding cassette domain-containing protein [Paenibacillus agricola]
MKLLDITNLTKHHHKENSPLFSGINAQINEPCIISVIGASGQGKSTLLRIIGMLESADEGTVRYRNRLSSEWFPHDWRTKVCYVAQQAVMLAGSVEDNLRTVSRLQKKEMDIKLAKQLLHAVKLEDLDWNKRAADLSGGEKQRLALVRSLLLRPEVLLLDEITASLDIQSKQAVEQLLLDWHNKEGVAMIWITHDLEQASQTSSQIWFMANNTLCENSPTKTFFECPATDLARGFLQIPDGTGEQA